MGRAVPRSRSPALIRLLVRRVAPTLTFPLCVFGRRATGSVPLVSWKNVSKLLGSESKRNELAARPLCCTSRREALLCLLTQPSRPTSRFLPGKGDVLEAPAAIWRKPTGSRPPAAGPPARALPFPCASAASRQSHVLFRAACLPEVPLAHAADPGRAQSFSPPLTPCEATHLASGHGRSRVADSLH